MSRWTIEGPTALDFDGVVALKVLLVSGNIGVLATGDRPSVRVTEVTGRPLQISHEAGMLDIVHENFFVEGLLKWLHTRPCRADVTVTVPPDCPVHVNLVDANAAITGLTSGVSLKSGTGDITLDGVSGNLDAHTVSGVVKVQGLDGAVSFTSVSGDLALTGGSVDRLTARTASGRVTADVELTDGGQIQVSTVSGEVTLRLPESTSAQVGLNTVGGRIDNSFTGLDPAQHSMSKGLTGTLGEGTGRLTVNTMSGNITLLNRPDGNARHGGGPKTEV